MTVCKIFVLEILKNVTGVLYEQNKSNKTIQRHESDTEVNPMHIDEIPIDIWFISSV